MAEETKTFRVPASLAQQVLLWGLAATIPTGGAFASHTALSTKLDEVAQGQHRLEGKFERLEGANVDGRIKSLEEEVQTLRERVAGLLAKEHSNDKH